MSTQHVAEVRATLRTNAFSAGLRNMGTEAASMGKKMGAAMSGPLKAGLASAKSQIGEMWSSVKSGIKTAATLGGALSLGKMITDSVQLQGKFRDIAFAMNQVPGNMVNWKNLQAQILPIAEETGQEAGKLADAVESIFGETGSADLAVSSIKAIGTIATASGKPVDMLGKIAGALGDKFGVTAKEMPDALAAVTQLASQGGLQFEDMEKALHLMGASARASGMTGAQGMQQMIAFANKGGDALGNLKKGLASITSMMDQMADPARQKEIKQAFGVDVVDKKGQLRDMQSVMGDVLSKTKGSKEKLGKVFKGEQLKLMMELGAPFREAFEKTGGDVRTKTKAGLDAFNENLKNAGKATFNFEEAQKRARERLKDDPSAIMRQALAQISVAFADPKMIESLKELAKLLPTVAAGMVKLTKFAVQNPALAVGGYAGAQVGMSFLASAGSKMTVDLAKGAWKGIGNKIAQDAARSGAWMTAGKALGVAVAAVIAFEIGRRKVEKDLDQFFGGVKNLQDAVGVAKVAGTEGHSLESKQKAIELLKTQIAQEKAKGGPGFVASRVGALSHLVTGGEVKTAEDTQANAIAKAEAELRNLEASVAKMRGGGDQATRALNTLTPAAERAAKSLNKMGGVPGERGTKGGGPPRPGAAPVEG